MFDDVVSTAAAQSGEESEALGSLAGRGLGFMQGRRHSFRANEYGTFMVIASLVPRVDYYQGIHRRFMKEYLSDVYSPAMDAIGMQDVMQYEFDAISADGDPELKFTTAAAKQPAWTEYMTAVNELHGDFAGDLRYWTLGRDMSQQIGTSSQAAGYLTSYVNPYGFNYAFADQAKDAQNFMVQLKFDAMFRRPISKRIMPSL